MWINDGPAKVQQLRAQKRLLYSDLGVVITPEVVNILALAGGRRFHD